ncbi:MAG TPA: hypothetical protein VLK65_20165 [Vicinamibacteria bacterium]|nr:hypothetical protein [Vicinamibacteria bacterium]
MAIGNVEQDVGKARIAFGDVAWNIEERRPGESGFELVLTDGSKRQTLYSADYTDEGGSGVQWTGDLDGDGQPDLILSASHKYSVSCSHVFLSRYASPDALLALVAEFCDTAC